MKDLETARRASDLRRQKRIDRHAEVKSPYGATVKAIREYPVDSARFRGPLDLYIEESLKPELMVQMLQERVLLSLERRGISPSKVLQDKERLKMLIERNIANSVFSTAGPVITNRRHLREVIFQLVEQYQKCHKDKIPTEIQTDLYKLIEALATSKPVFEVSTTGQEQGQEQSQVEQPALYPPPPPPPVKDFRTLEKRAGLVKNRVGSFRVSKYQTRSSTALAKKVAWADDSAKDALEKLINGMDGMKLE